MKKLIYLLVFVLCISDLNIVNAEAPKNKHILIIYTKDESKAAEQVRILDSLLGHFSKNISIIEDNKLDTINKSKFNYIFYINLTKRLYSEVGTFVDDFKGPVFIIGRSIDLTSKRFNFIKTNGETLINSITLLSNNLELHCSEDRIVVNIKPNTSAEVLLLGRKKEGGNIPLLVKKNQSYYLAAESLFDPIGKALGEILFSFFNQQSDKQLHKYLRLEDVNPKADYNVLMEIAKYLKSKHIPYMIALIPVYVNPESGEEVHLSNSPQLVKTLQYMQNNGASIILHGYRHQYSNEETGEGFEFWDVKQNRPIMQEQSQLAKGREDFSTEQKYQSYVIKGKAYEKKYFTEAIQSGVQELVTHKLYPLAFEAPHYSMSQEGYKILSKHFSTYVGKVQLTDQTWKGVYAPLYDSTPHFLHGMKLLPETVGYVVDGDKDSINNIRSTALINEEFSDAYISSYYHPYLGISKLKKLVNIMESVPNAEWLDLKNSESYVSIPKITLSASYGKVIVKKSFISSDYERNYILKKIILWIAVFLLLLSLIVYKIISKKMRKKTTLIN